MVIIIAFGGLCVLLLSFFPASFIPMCKWACVCVNVSMIVTHVRCWQNIHLHHSHLVKASNVRFYFASLLSQHFMTRFNFFPHLSLMLYLTLPFAFTLASTSQHIPFRECRYGRNSHSLYIVFLSGVNARERKRDRDRGIGSRPECWCQVAMAKIHTMAGTKEGSDGVDMHAYSDCVHN